jgi:hypothetical protein
VMFLMGLVNWLVYWGILATLRWLIRRLGEKTP